MVIVKRFDIRPYFKKIADYYWDHLDPATDGSIWDWLAKDYGVFRVGPRVDNTMAVGFTDEASYTAFLLRWA